MWGFPHLLNYRDSNISPIFALDSPLFQISPFSSSRCITMLPPPIAVDSGAAPPRFGAVSVEAMGDRKLLEGEKTEVRFFEEGLKGSWHRGTIIGSAKLVRFVEYDDLDAEDGLSKLVECLPVSLAVEGLTDVPLENCRGNIRPLPPRRMADGSEIRRGMCVDALFDNAWWEGVVFDHEEGSPNWLIFFPDQGDQHLVHIDQLRPTLDWEELTGEWKARSDWVLLKLLDDIGKEDPLPISIRQIWYDISCMDIFRQNIGEWLFGSQSAWHSLILEVITKACSVAQGQLIMQIFPVSESVSIPSTSGYPEMKALNYDFPKVAKESNSWLSNEDEDSTASGKKGCLSSDYSECFSDTILEDSSEAKTSSFSGDAILEDSSEAKTSSSSGDPTRESDLFPECSKNVRKASKKRYVSHRNKYHHNPVKVFQPWENVEATDKSSTSSGHWSDSLSEICKQSKIVHGTRASWEDAKITARYCPEALTNLKVYEKHKRPWLFNKDLIMSAKMHLVALGWRIFYNNGGKSYKSSYLYQSPDGLNFYSLRLVYFYLLNTKAYLFREDDPTEGHGSESVVKDELPEVAEEVSRIESVAAENCPGAVEDYVSYMQAKHSERMVRKRNEEREKRLKAKKHLLYLGWKFYSRKANGSHVLCYKSPPPRQKTFCSLITACKASLGMHDKGVGVADTDVQPLEKLTYSCPLYEHKQKSRRKFGRSSYVNHSTALDKVELSDSREKMGPYPEYLEQSDCRSVNGSVFFSGRTQVKEHQAKKSSKRKTDQSICTEDFHDVEVSPKDGDSFRAARKFHRGSCRSRIKRAQDVSPLSPSHHVPRTIVSWLIDNDVVLPRQKVRYIRKEDGCILMEGRITRDGINCNCCKKVYTLANFEAHTGSNVHQPASNIFLHEGRSLWDCQRLILEKRRVGKLPRKRTKGNNSIFPSDSICSICQYGGDLILCDGCPACFHSACVDLQDVPDGDWFCPSCQCSKCGLSEFNNDIEKFSEETILFCDQCECEFHVGCVMQPESERLTCCPEGPWFCSTSCSRIFVYLRGIVGKRNSTSVQGISWTLLRSQGNDFEAEKFEKESWIEHHSKLCVALEVLHECFVSLIEPRTKTDLVEDLLFNAESELRRLNFWGFYTILLEKGDELISVATFRVYGEKVAEMPFVGTRVQYRRRGMCRLLIDELEKLLGSIGVERLLLPAVPQLLQTWKNSFGFHEMTLSDRLLLSRHTFLSFQGTTMCQKLLKSSVATSGELRDDANCARGTITCCNNKMGPCCNSNTSSSEVLEKMQIIY